jgi:hypothetical protein
MLIALIALAVAAFLALDGYILWICVGPGKGRRRRIAIGERGAARIVRACQVLGAVLVVAGLAAIAARAGGVISDHWLAAHWSCSDGTDFERRACVPHEAALAVWELAGGAIFLGLLGLSAPALRAASTARAGAAAGRS